MSPIKKRDHKGDLILFLIYVLAFAFLVMASVKTK